MPPDLAVDITIQVLRAAKFAHKRGVVHRDIKPHNVILDYEGRAKVTDFGIARAGASDMTETGSIMGTAQYLSPEQAQGQPGQPALGPLLDRRDALRAADRAGAVRRRVARDDRAQARLRAAGAAVGAQPGDPAGARGGRDARAREGPGAALRRRRRVRAALRGARASRRSWARGLPDAGRAARGGGGGPARAGGCGCCWRWC